MNVEWGEWGGGGELEGRALHGIVSSHFAAHKTAADVPGEEKLVSLAARVMDADARKVEEILYATKYQHLSQESESSELRGRLGTLTAGQVTRDSHTHTHMHPTPTVEKFAGMVEERLKQALQEDARQEEKVRPFYHPRHSSRRRARVDASARQLISRTLIHTCHQHPTPTIPRPFSSHLLKPKNRSARSWRGWSRCGRRRRRSARSWTPRPTSACMRGSAPA